MKLKWLTWMFVVFFAIGGGVAQAALVSETFNLTSNHITDGGFGIVPFGKVVLTQDGTGVDFTVTLFNNNLFIRTGAGDGMNFKFNGSGVVVGDINGTGLTAATGNFNGDGTGMFHFGVYTTGQATGGGAGVPGPIAFTVLSATIADLTAKNDLGYVFAADIILGAGQGASTGKTGMVDASSPVPIPPAVWLLGSGLVGLFGIRRRFWK